jgi:hypothetical protein
MASISVDASNELPASFHATIVGVTGEGFEPGTDVNIGVFGGDLRRVVAHAVVGVQADGSFSWGATLRPKRACNSGVTVIVHDHHGKELSDTAEVFCP